MTTQGSAVAETRNLRHYTKVIRITRNTLVVVSSTPQYYSVRRKLRLKQSPRQPFDYNTSTKGLLPPGDGNSSEAAYINQTVFVMHFLDRLHMHAAIKICPGQKYICQGRCDWYEHPQHLKRQSAVTDVSCVMAEFSMYVLRTSHSVLCTKYIFKE